jgi:hypothetical protein
MRRRRRRSSWPSRSGPISGAASPAAELAVRRGFDAGARAALPRVVLLLDGYSGFASENDGLAGEGVREALARVWADGPGLGVDTRDRGRSDRRGSDRARSLAQQRLAFQLADTPTTRSSGSAAPRCRSSSADARSPAAAVRSCSGQVVQIARETAGLKQAVAARQKPGPVEGGPAPIGVLPDSVSYEALLGAGQAGREPLFIPFAIGDETLRPVGFELYEAEHATIAGRADGIEGLGHWSGSTRRSRRGMLIRPDVSVDGMPLGVALPRRPEPPARPGCGYRVDAGGYELVQVATVE